MHVAVFPGGVMQGPWVLSVGGMHLSFIAGCFGIFVNGSGGFRLHGWNAHPHFAKI